MRLRLSDYRRTTQDNLVDFVEGRLNVENAGRTYVPPQKPHFVRMIVIDVVDDPNMSPDSRAELAEEWQRLGVSNMDLVNVLPRNTIVGQRVGDDSPPMFVFPFFPSSLSLPAKPGEAVWVFVENPAARTVDVAYWVCRIVEPHTSDDVNHSHPGRSSEPSFHPGSKSKSDGSDPWFELRNTPVTTVDGERVAVRDGSILVGHEDDIFESIVQETTAKKRHVYEPVPRFRKRSPDVVLEGSNNTLISLGFARSGSIDIDPLTEQGRAGSIDIVAGRGYTADTAGRAADTTSFVDASKSKKGTVLKRELDKSPDALAPREGDPDFKNDRSRLLVSQRMKVDGSFEISFPDVTDSADGDAGIVLKSDKVRIIARSDISFIVTDYDESTEEGFTGRKDESTDPTRFASITIKRNGDIVFTPSEKGYVRLGGPDADKGVVCTDQPVTTEDGTVVGGQLVTTMGGSFAGSVKKGTANNASAQLGKNQGKYASKVLVKLHAQSASGGRPGWQWMYGPCRHTHTPRR